MEAALKIDEERTVKEIRALVPRLDGCSPKPRCSLHSTVYPHYVRRVFPDQSHALFLEALGVIRREGVMMQFWAADNVCDEQETMQQILDEAKRMQRIFEDNCFQVVGVDRVPILGGGA